jgi:putative DNA primase/helicase
MNIVSKPLSIDLPIPDSKCGVYPANESDFTDAGNADFFATRYDGEWIFVHGGLGWCYWDGKRFVPDQCEAVYIAMQKAIKSIPKMCANPSGFVDLEKRLYKHVAKSLDKNRIMSAIALAARHPSIAKSIDQINSNIHLFNIENGTINLQSNKICSHSKAILITKIAHVSFEKNAKRQKWQEFLNTIFSGDQTLISYVQKVIGLCLSGEMNHQCFWLFFGTGANGKSVFIAVLSKLLGDYFMRSSSDFLMKSRDGAPVLEITDLSGIRFLETSEVAEGCVLNTQLLKDLTGGESVKGRQHYQNFKSIIPLCKVFIVGNHPPRIRETDHGIWRRVQMIPFKVTIPEEKRRPFTELVDDLCTELPGILLWALEGWRAYKEHGLGQCPAIAEATGEYKDENDLVGSYLIERTEQVSDKQIQCKLLYANYRGWCQEVNEYEMKRRVFDQKVMEHSIEKKIGTDGQMVWRGLRLKDEF